MSNDDARFMRMAIELSRRGLGATAENPPVGCFIIQGSAVVGRGFTGRGGRPHAEAIALSQAGEKARGATAYVTLEPCAHHGQTPPCAEALIKAGIARVVCALSDPDTRVKGQGLEILRARGISVKLGVAADEARQVLHGYLSRKIHGKPHVQLKLAISSDEMLATNDPDKRWITGTLARDRGHLMRACSDAIVVGVGTVLSDDPELTCRLSGLENRSPLRVVIDTNLRTPLNSRLVTSAKQTTLVIACSEKTQQDKQRPFEENGVELLKFACRSGHLDLTAVLAKLAARGINRVLFEGGAQIANSLVKDGLIDEFAIFKAPARIGNKGYPAFASKPLKQIIDELSLVEDYKLTVGPDELSLYHRRHLT